MAVTTMNNSACVLDPCYCHLIVKSSPTARGHRYMFFLSDSGTFEGKLFPTGAVRIYGRNSVGTTSSSSNKCADTFFIECRNSKRRQFGLAASMIPRRGPKIMPGSLFASCDFVLVQGIHFDMHGELMIKYHRWNGSMKYSEFLDTAGTPTLKDAIQEAFDINIESPLKGVHMVYLNAILGTTWVDVKGPDIWYNMNIGHTAYKLFRLPDSQRRENCNIWKKRKDTH